MTTIRSLSDTKVSTFGAPTHLYSSVASLSSSCTALPSDAYSFFVFNFNLAFVAIKFAIPVRKSTLSFSNSTRSDIVVSGSYLWERRREWRNYENSQFVGKLEFLVAWSIRSIRFIVNSSQQLRSISNHLQFDHPV